MGGGSYSFSDRSSRLMASGTMHKSVSENFERKFQSVMSPEGVFRESRDSEEHPNSVPFIVALDVTGSMGRIPQMFLLEGLPTLMSVVFDAGVKDPQLLFIAVGDHEYDKAPLQVGQFESSDELVDRWLQKVWPEGGGGGNDGESYSLAWLFAAYQTETDSFKKRGQKGFLFTIGDEPVLKNIPAHVIKNITGLSQTKTSSDELLEEASKTYHVFHIHVTQTSSGSSQKVQRGWKELMGDRCILVNDFKDIPKVIGQKIVELSAKNTMAPVTASSEPTAPSNTGPVIY